jgi:hypothetical protein
LRPAGERVEAESDLQVDDERQREGVERALEGGLRHDARREPAVGEQRHRQQRGAVAPHASALVEHEDAEQHDARGDGPPQPRRPAERLALDERHHEREHDGAQQRDADEVEAHRARRPRLRHEPGGEHEDHDAHRDVDEEHVRQPRPQRSASTSQPPSTGPSTAARPLTPPMRPYMGARSLGENSACTEARSCGTISAAKSPCAMRVTTSASPDQAKAAAARRA